MPIAFRAAGVVANGPAAITPALPAGIVTDDILLLFLETANQAITIPTPNGGTWAEVADSPQSQGTPGAAGGNRLTCFWSRYNGTQGAPTTSDSGDHQTGQILAYSGCITTGDPWDVTAGDTQAATTDGSIPGDTTTVDGCMIVAAASTDVDLTSTTIASAWTNASLVSITERVDGAFVGGTGGGLVAADGIKTTAGVVDSTTWTHGGAGANLCNLMIALKPPAAGGGASVTPAVVPATTTLPTPTILAAATLAPAVIPIAATLPTPLIAAAAKVTPAVIAVVVTLPTPTAASGPLPSDIAGLVLWLKADAITGLSDGDPITTWADQSVEDNDATSATPPSYQTNELNGLPVARFDGVNDGMGTPLTLTHPYTIFYVGKYNDVDSQLRRIIASDSANWLMGPYSGVWQWYSGDFADPGPDATDGAWVIHAVRADTASGTHFVWDLITETAPFSAARATPDAVGNIALGFSSSSEPAESDVAEVVVYDSELSDTDRDLVVAYFREKWAGVIPANVTPAVVSVGLTLPTPTIDVVAAATVTPAVLPVAAALPTPAILAGAVVTPAVIATTVALPTPTVASAAVVTPTVVAVTSTLPTPAILAGANVTPAVIPVAASLLTPTVVAGAAANVTPATVATVVTLPTPTVVAASTVTPAVIPLTVTLPTPTIISGAGAVVTPVTVAAIAALPTPAILAAATVTPASIAVVATLPTPTIDVVGAGIVTPAVIAVAAALPTPTVLAGVVVDPATVAVAVDLPTPTITATPTVTPAAITVAVTLPTPALLAAATVTLDVIPLTALLPTPTIFVQGAAVTVTPAVIAAIAGLPTPAITIDAVVTPAGIALVATVPNPTVTIPGLVTPATIPIIVALPSAGVAIGAITFWATNPVAFTKNPAVFVKVGAGDAPPW